MRSIPNPSFVTIHESTRYHEASSSISQKASHVIGVFAVHTTFHRFQSTVHRVPNCLHGDAVTLFYSSFIQSERFFQTDQLITRIQVVFVTNFIRLLMKNVFVNVFESDAVIWWAAIFRAPSTMFD